MFNSKTALLITRLKAVAEPVRLRLLALCQQGECSVSELTTVLLQSQPRVSQQLKILCDAGLLERFRDGQRVYYRLATSSDAGASRRQLLQLLPGDDPQLEADAERLRAVRGIAAENDAGELAHSVEDRALHRAILDLTVADAVGDLLDVGCGRGQLLKLLASRANRAVGVDIDADARDLARREMLLAGLKNCSLRKGDMYQLPFADAEFDTVILDDVLADAAQPDAVLQEACRLLRAGGRLLLLQRVAGTNPDRIAEQMAASCRQVSLRLAPARRIPQKNPEWLLAVARTTEPTTAAA